MKDAADEAAVLLYSLETDMFLEDLTRNADRVFYLDEGPRADPKLVESRIQRLKRTRRHWRCSRNSIRRSAENGSPLGINEDAKEARRD
jgi:hypothetical protein